MYQSFSEKAAQSPQEGPYSRAGMGPYSRAGMGPYGSAVGGPYGSVVGGPYESQAGAQALRAVHVSYGLMPAGIDFWLSSLVRYSDMRRLRFLRCIVTGNHVDLNHIYRIGAPIEVGGRESVRRASEDCDVMLISDPGDQPDWVAEARAKLRIFVAHGDGPWTRARLEALAPVVDHVVAVSSRVERSVCQGFPTTVIENGVDPLHLARSAPPEEVRKGLGFRPDDFVLGYVGRFSQEKNPFALLEALAQLPTHFKALLVGFGPLRNSMLERANELVPGRFAMVRGEDYLGDHYGAMDAFCMVSHSEGYSLAIMEAMMCGKPVIVSEVGFVPDAIIDRVNGLIVRGDAPSIRDAALLLDRHRDWAASVGREAQTYANRKGFASTMAKRYADLVDKLWTTRGGGARASA